MGVAPYLTRRAHALVFIGKPINRRTHFSITRSSFSRGVSSMNTNIELNHRHFSSPGQGFWPDATPQQWNDWSWQMRNSIKSLEQLAGKIELSRE